MATRSRIGIQLKDNSVLSVYHHWDGYPQWLGRILTTHYNTKEKVAELPSVVAEAENVTVVSSGTTIS